MLNVIAQKEWMTEKKNISSLFLSWCVSYCTYIRHSEAHYTNWTGVMELRYPEFKSISRVKRLTLSQMDGSAPWTCRVSRVLVSGVLALCGSSAAAINLEGELFKDLMKGYNKNVRPMASSGDITRVDVKMTLTNLISLVSSVWWVWTLPVAAGAWWFTPLTKLSLLRMKRRRRWQQASG